MVSVYATFAKKVTKIQKQATNYLAFLMV